MTQSLIAPLVRELPADLDTPIGVYLKLRGHGPSFLLESVEGGERVARYSFIGVSPSRVYTVRGHTVQRRTAAGAESIELDSTTDPLKFLQAELEPFHLTHSKGLPRFIGGLIGYMGYEMVAHVEPKLASHLKPSALPEAVFLLADTIVAFDHARRSVFLIAHVFDGDHAAAERALDEIEARLRAPLANSPIPNSDSQTAPCSNLSQAEYEAMVLKAKDHIAAGDIFQVVLSQRFTRQTSAAPFDVYRAVRRLNPYHVSESLTRSSALIPVPMKSTWAMTHGSTPC